MNELLFSVGGLLVGMAIVYFLLNPKLVKYKLSYDTIFDQCEKLKNVENERLRLFGSSQADAATIKALKERIDALEADKVNLEVNLRKIVTDVTNESIVKQGKILSEQQSSKLSDLLDPLRERIKEFQSKVENNQTESVKSNSALMEQIRALTTLNQTVTQKTEDLTNALRGSNKTAGGWGEMILERVLERSGLRKGAEYETQFTTQNSNGTTIRPDAVIFLPDNKNLIVDSKVSLVAYEQYVNSDDALVRDSALKAHISSIRGHIKQLSEKDYHTGAGLNSPEFTLLFIPIESGFALSVKEDTSLFEYAWERKIVMVSPSTLLATLRTIASVWKHENQTRNAIEIAQKAGDLYDKFVGFTEDMTAIGTAINKAHEVHEKAMNKLSTGKGNLINRANQMRDLGVKTTKSISPNLTNGSEE